MNRVCYRCGRREWTEDPSRCEGSLCILLTDQEEKSRAQADPYLDFAARRQFREGLVALVVCRGLISLNRAVRWRDGIVALHEGVVWARCGWSNTPDELREAVCCVLGVLDQKDIPEQVLADWVRDTVENAGCHIGP